MSARWHVLIAMLAVFAFSAGCGGGDSSNAGDTSGVSEPKKEQSESADTPGDAVAGDDPAPEPTEAPPTTEPAPPPEAILPFPPDAPVMIELTEPQGGGARPLLAWEPVVRAAVYYVFVYAETSEPYWAAVTAETEVFVGGPGQIPDGRDGPRIAPGYWWVVYAEDAAGNPVGSSPQAAISP